MILKLNDNIVKRCENLDLLIARLEKKVKQFPDGRLKISRRFNKTIYYLCDQNNKNGRIIKDDESILLCNLAQKSYYGKVIRSAKAERNALRLSLVGFPKITAEEIYMTLSEERRALVNPIYRPDDEYVSDWLSEDYERKGFKEGTPYYETMNGERVRSKSEQIIADHLKKAGIPYKYEYPTMINGKIIHPDFKILRVSDRMELYLEHCGRVDKPGYYDDMVIRINSYAMNGIFIGCNLFLLFETADVPLDVRVLDKLIEEQFR